MRSLKVIFALGLIALFICVISSFWKAQNLDSAPSSPSINENMITHTSFSIYWHNLRYSSKLKFEITTKIPYYYKRKIDLPTYISNATKLQQVASSYSFSQASCCTDGSGKAHGSSSHISETAYFTAYYRQGKRYTEYLNADTINYIVEPRGMDKLGHGAIVIDLITGNYIYALVGDVGPSTSYPFHELSYAALQNLGYKRASGKWAPKGQFLVYVLDDLKFNQSSSYLSNNLTDLVQDYLDSCEIDIDMLISELLN